MNFKAFSSFDKKLLLVAITFLILFSFLLFNDHILISLVSRGSQKIAQITSVKNDVRIKYSSDFRWTPISKGAVHIGDYLFTGSKGSASIRFDDGSSIEVEENSLIVFSVSNGQSTLILKQGNLSGNTTQIRIEKSEAMVLSSLSKLPSSIKTVDTSRPIITEPPTYSKKEIPFSMEEPFLPQKNEIQIQWIYNNNATEFEVEIAKDVLFNQMEKVITTHEKKIISPHLVEGMHFIRVRAKNKTTKRWSKFVEVEILKNKQSNTTYSALEAPSYKEESRHLATSNGLFNIRWSSVKGATSYRVELSNDSKLKNSKIFVVDSNQIKINYFLNPHRFFRVTALDESNNVGIKGKTAKIILSANSPSLHPVQDKTFWSKSKDDKIPVELFQLAWDKAHLAETYLVELSTDKRFSSVKRFSVKQNKIFLNINKINAYHWRVTPFLKDNTPLSSPSVGSFKYIREYLPIAPTLLEPKDQSTVFFQTAKNISFYMLWEPIPDASSYVVEVANDSKFESLLFHQKTNKNRFLFSGTSNPMKVPPYLLSPIRQLASESPKTIYWRVRTIKGSYSSPWSKTKKATIYSGRLQRK